MERPLISVLISAYNAADTIEASIRSCLNQDIRDLEVIVIDDGSKDNTLKILNNLANRDQRVRVFHHENMGLTRSLNRGLLLCRAPVVARLDADDICLPGRFRKQLDFLNSNPDHALVGSYALLQINDQQRIETHPIHHEAILKALPGTNPFIHPSVAFRRDTVLDIGGYDEGFRYAQDYELWFRLLHVSKGHNLPEPLIIRRIYSGMISESRGRSQLGCAIRARLKNLAISPNPTASLFHALRLSAKWPLYSPKIRVIYRKFRKNIGL